MTLVLQPDEPKPTARRGGEPSPETKLIQQTLTGSAGRWFLIYEGCTPADASQRVNRMRRSKGAWSGQAWDAKSARQDDGSYKVWGRYLGAPVRNRLP